MDCPITPRPPGPLHTHNSVVDIDLSKSTHISIATVRINGMRLRQALLKNAQQLVDNDCNEAAQLLLDKADHVTKAIRHLSMAQDLR
jgi:hypothetical protein